MRKKRVESYLRREIAQIINQQMNDPRLGMITVTEVSVSKDLKLAVVYISALEKQEEKLSLLENAKGYIKHLLGQHYEMKFMPDLTFKIDRSYDEGKRIDKLLEEIKKTDSGE